jgi:hypothetical protein
LWLKSHEQSEGDLEMKLFYYTYSVLMAVLMLLATRVEAGPDKETSGPDTICRGNRCVEGETCEETVRTVIAIPCRGLNCREELVNKDSARRETQTTKYVCEDGVFKEDCFTIVGVNVSCLNDFIECNENCSLDEVNYKKLIGEPLYWDTCGDEEGVSSNSVILTGDLSEDILNLEDNFDSEQLKKLGGYLDLFYKEASGKEATVVGLLGLSKGGDESDPSWCPPEDQSEGDTSYQ